MNRKKWYIILYGIVIIVILALYFHVNKRNIIPQNTNLVTNTQPSNTPADARLLSSEQEVVPYLKEHHRLPDYYITKEAAREQGWTPAKGNLCDVLPGKIIGGDRFFDRDRQLPEKNGRKWFEADLNYDCATRNADRLLYSNDGLIFVTYDHYRTFQEK